jgi:hypothetical protein
MIRKPGILRISPLTAKLFRDTETFGKMDPYVQIKIGDMKLKTKTHDSGGKAPRWSDTL